jgi:SAM-dependent methyltransferase
MNPKVRTALAAINRAFYTEFAGDFAQTRQSWPPGYQGILPYLEAAFNVLDVGCGNARLLLFLYQAGWRGRYLGVDSSPRLIAIAKANSAGLEGVDADVREADLLSLAWPDAVAGFAPQVIACLAVLQHIPGADARAAFVRAAADLLLPGGVLVLSTWQFLSSPRLRSHILPWPAAGLSDADVEPGDYLISWGQGAAGQRYCALIDEAQIRGLAASASLDVAATFYADGHEGNLNLYAVLKRA